MRVRIRLFAILRERAGVSMLDLELPEGATVAQAVALLADAHGVAAPPSRRIAFAVNCAYCDASTILREGDELALIPPVSGG